MEVLWYALFVLAVTASFFSGFATGLSRGRAEGAKCRAARRALDDSLSRCIDQRDDYHAECNRWRAKYKALAAKESEHG